MKKFANETLTIVDVMRHGECEGGEIYRGCTDVALTPHGWQQMNAAVNDEVNNKTDWDLIVSSPLKRCREFAEKYAERIASPLVIEPNLKEINFGDWEGKPVSEVHEQYAKTVTAFYKDPTNNSPPNGESLSSVQQRVSDVFWRHVDQNNDKRLLFIQHGVTIRVLIVELLGLPLAQLGGFEIPFAGHVQFKIYTGKSGRRVTLSRLA